MWMMVPVIFIIKDDTTSEEEEIANPFRFYLQRSRGRSVCPPGMWLLAMRGKRFSKSGSSASCGEIAFSICMALIKSDGWFAAMLMAIKALVNSGIVSRLDTHFQCDLPLLITSLLVLDHSYCIWSNNLAKTRIT